MITVAWNVAFQIHTKKLNEDRYSTYCSERYKRGYSKAIYT